MNLRTRILKTGINCLPWKHWRDEIDLLPVSSQTLFRRSGLQIDLLEIELRSEGFLLQSEDLIKVLKTESNLKRNQFGLNDNHADIGNFPEDWKDEDYKDFYGYSDD